MCYAENIYQSRGSRLQTCMIRNLPSTGGRKKKERKKKRKKKSMWFRYWKVQQCYSYVISPLPAERLAFLIIKICPIASMCVSVCTETSSEVLSVIDYYWGWSVKLTDKYEFFLLVCLEVICCVNGILTVWPWNWTFK